MKIENLTYSANKKWQPEHHSITTENKTNIVFVFGDREAFKSQDAYQSLHALYPNAHIVGCSSSGNIQGDALSDAEMVASALSFDTSSVEIAVTDFTQGADQVSMTTHLINQLPKEGLKHVFILSDGLHINGSSLAKGANEALEYKIPITGGLAGDGTAFEETWVIANDVAKQKRVVAVGFYGDHIHIQNGCFAGWEEFGITRSVTKAQGNIVYEIDHQPALELYKKYLGDYAKDLPSSGLHFPINIKQHKEDRPLVRTLLGIDESQQSLIFAGDVPEGSLARLMKADIDTIIEGAKTAAESTEYSGNHNALGLVVSCVGRRLVLNQLTDEELESVSEVLGSDVSLLGFYSYGELAPFSNKLRSCQLHNQTLTLTVINEG